MQRAHVSHSTVLFIRAIYRAARWKSYPKNSKTSNERLRVMAARIGSVSEEEIAAMDRAALLQIVAAGSMARAEGEKM